MSIKDNKRIGFIELGKEIDTFLPTLEKLKSVDLILAIEKRFLEKNSWEEGLKAMNKSGEWNLFQAHVISHNTMDELPEELSHALEKHAERHGLESFDLVCNDCQYRVAAIPMIQADGTEVGDLFVFVELHELLSGSNAFLYFAIIATLVVILFYLSFSIYLGRVEDDLARKQHDLEKEISSHIATENELSKNQQKLDELVKSKSEELEKAMTEVNILSGFLPICASCKNIRNDKGEWEQIEAYIREHSEAEFSHSYCPDCAKKLYSGFRK